MWHTQRPTVSLIVSKCHVVSHTSHVTQTDPLNPSLSFLISLCHTVTRHFLASNTTPEACPHTWRGSHNFWMLHAGHHSILCWGAYPHHPHCWPHGGALEPKSLEEHRSCKGKIVLPALKVMETEDLRSWVGGRG